MRSGNYHRTGWRIRSEVLMLRWSQVDFQHGWDVPVDAGASGRLGNSTTAALALVGHKTQSIYNRYAIVAEQDLKDAGEKLATSSCPGQEAQGGPAPAEVATASTEGLYGRR
jgi:hypothetical protein